MTGPGAPAASTGRRTLRLAVAATATVIALCLLCAGGVTLSLLDGLADGDDPVSGLGCGDGRRVDPQEAMPRIGGLVEEQVRNAAVIIGVGQELGVPPRGWVIAVAAALQESRLTNLPHLGNDNDHDSIGLFQQRPSQGWGSAEQLAEPAYQARRFFQKLLRVPGWETLPLTVAAQRVQVSAYPDAYAKHEPLAARVVDALTGGASRAVGAEAELRCAAAGDIAASGWTVPVGGPITSGFRTEFRPGHNGVDIAVPKGTPVRAASAGVIVAASCNAHVGERDYSCDRDGGAFVLGCGWYVDILHAGNTMTRYCHLVARPEVRIGEYVATGHVIGRSGSSGNSSGPHLHFEIHIDGDASPRGAVNPVPFMNEVGAPLIGAG